MKKNILIGSWFSAICLSIIALTLSYGAESPNEPPIKFQSFKVPAPFKERFNAMCQAVDLQSWPETDTWRAAPKINKSLLSSPGLITRENVSFGNGPFRDETWAGCVGVWSWRRRVQNEEPLPTELPPEHKQRLMAFLSREGKLDDHNFVEEFLNRKLESYRKSKMYSVTGQMSIRLCVAPNSQAAHEYLIYQKRRSSLPTELALSCFSESNRLENLGTIGFFKLPNVMFVRDNIAVVIDARGELASQALPLAQKIDSLIQQQAPLTYQELLARRPSVTIAANVDEARINGRRTISYDISVPAGQEIVSVRASIDGQSTTAKDGKITLADKSGTFGVKLTVITNELLATTFGRELIIDE